MFTRNQCLELISCAQYSLFPLSLGDLKLDAEVKDYFVFLLFFSYCAKDVHLLTLLVNQGI